MKKACFTRLESQMFAGNCGKRRIFFSLKDITLSKKIHEVKEVKENILKEGTWFERAKKRCPPSPDMLVQQETLTQFQKRPLNGVNGRCGNKENSTTFNI